MSRSASPQGERRHGSRRAPRLGPRAYLAPHLTRPGRFARIDPLRGRPLPGLARVLGAVGWSALLGYAGWQAWRRRDGDGAEPG